MTEEQKQIAAAAQAAREYVANITLRDINLNLDDITRAVRLAGKQAEWMTDTFRDADGTHWSVHTCLAINAWMLTRQTKDEVAPRLRGCDIVEDASEEHDLSWKPVSVILKKARFAIYSRQDDQDVLIGTVEGEQAFRTVTDVLNLDVYVEAAAKGAGGYFYSPQITTAIDMGWLTD
jgi:hypothetical protein